MQIIPELKYKYDSSPIKKASAMENPSHSSNHNEIPFCLPIQLQCKKKNKKNNPFCYSLNIGFSSLYNIIVRFPDIL